MTSPPTWALADLEKQDVSEANTSPTDGDTTLADENTEVPESEDFGFEYLNLTDLFKAQ
jgi:hypothetical protein